MEENCGYWYDVVVDARDERCAGDSMHLELHFVSYYNALYVARNWANCADAYHVCVLDGNTGEVYYHFDEGAGEWEKEI